MGWKLAKDEQILEALRRALGSRKTMCSQRELRDKALKELKKMEPGLTASGVRLRRLAITSDGEKSKLTLLGEGEANKIHAIADAEAYRTRITGEAEGAKVIAIGQSEAKAMQLKADAWKQYTDAAKLQMIVERLPEIAMAMSKPLENTQKIIIMGNEGSTGLVRTTADSIAKLPAVVEALTGTTLTELIDKVATAAKGSGPKN